MTDDEAWAVAQVIAAVDGECIVCASYAACGLAKAMPWHNWFALVAEASGHWTEESLREDAPCQPN